MQTKTTIRATTKRTQNLGLTVPKATTQARRIVDKVMPGVMATVDSRTSWDMDTDAQVIITTVTFPETADASGVACWADALPDAIRSTWSSCRIVITRKVK